MKVIILAAGYGTRLEQDLKQSDEYTNLIGVPKPLLPIGNKPLISHWTDCIEDIEDIDAVYVVTNATNHKMFEEWAVNKCKVKLVSDGATSNETRSGAVACMNLAVEQFHIEDDVIIIAGDTLFPSDFQLTNYLSDFKSYKSKDDAANMLLYVTCTDEEVHKYGILETDGNSRVVGFLEKPQPTQTTSRKECPCFYFLNRKSLSLLADFLEEKKDEPMKARDATGNFIVYLYQKHPVYTTEISSRFDVGGLETYRKCHEYFLASESQ